MHVKKLNAAAMNGYKEASFRVEPSFSEIKAITMLPNIIMTDNT